MVLEVKGVCHSFTSKNKEFKVLENITFNVGDREFISIVGKSGCGKTTILNLISNILKVQKGGIEWHVDKKFGYMLQTDTLFEWRTVKDNILLGLEISKKLSNESIGYALDLAERYGLTQYLKSYPNELSGGLRQRVALIRTLALKPNLLLLDEPFAHLDYDTRMKISADVWSIVREQGISAILVTHDIEEAVAMSDKIIVLTDKPATVKMTEKLVHKSDDLVERKMETDIRKWVKAVFE